MLRLRQALQQRGLRRNLAWNLHVRTGLPISAHLANAGRSTCSNGAQGSGSGLPSQLADRRSG